jgi:hypothetical protein
LPASLNGSPAQAAGGLAGPPPALAVVLAAVARLGRFQILSSLVFARIPHFDYLECDCHAESELWN